MKEKASGLWKHKKKLVRVVSLAAMLVLVVCMLAGCASSTPSGPNGEPNGLWEWFCQFMAKCVEFCYGPVKDWGMAIIIFTVIFRILIAPLMHKQAKSSYQMQKIQPMIQEIQAKYADDQPRQQAEMQKLYADAKYNPLAGCVPMLLQMPIFIALFTALRNIDSYITGVDKFTWYNIVPDLLQSPAGAFEEGFGAFLPYLILMIVFAGATFLPMLLQQINNKASQQRTQMIIMSAFMMLMMLWVSWGSPAGVLLYWGLSSVLGILQTQLTTHYLKKKDEEAEIAKANEPVKVEVTRKVQKKRPRKKR